MKMKLNFKIRFQDINELIVACYLLLDFFKFVEKTIEYPKLFLLNYHREENPHILIKVFIHNYRFFQKEREYIGNMLPCSTLNL